MLGNVAGGLIKQLSGDFFGIYTVILCATILSALFTFFMRADNADACAQKV